MSCVSCSTCGTTPTSARAPALAPVPAPARGSPAVGDDERDEDHSDNEYVLSEDNPNISELSLLSRVMDARRCWSIPLDETSQDTWNQLFNDIGMTLAGHSVHAVKPLVAIFDRDGPKAFLDVAIWCVLRNIRDELLCWAFVYCEEDVTRMTQAIVNGDRDLIAHINKQAAFHECFPGNRHVGRARVESHADTDRETEIETETETDTGVPRSLQATPTPTPTPAQTPTPTATQTSQPLETRVQQYIDDCVRDIIDQHRAWLGKTAPCPSSASVSPSPSGGKREPQHNKHLNQNLNQNQPRLSTHTLTQSTSQQSQPQQQPLRSQSAGTITASAASCGEACRCDAAAPASTCTNTDTETCTSTSTSTSTCFSCHPHPYPNPHPHHPHPPDTLFPMTPRSLLRTAKSPTSRKSVSFLPVPDIIPASQLSPLVSPQQSPEAEPQPEPSSVSASASALTSLDELHHRHSKQTTINLTLSTNHHPKQRELPPHELNHDTSYFSSWSRHLPLPLPLPLPSSLASLLTHPTVFSIISVVAAGGVAFVAFRNRRLWNMR